MSKIAELNGRDCHMNMITKKVRKDFKLLMEMEGNVVQKDSPKEQWDMLRKAEKTCLCSFREIHMNALKFYKLRLTSIAIQHTCSTYLIFFTT